MSSEELELFQALETKEDGGYDPEDISKFHISNDSVERMNDGIVDNINKKVKPKDRLFILGDLGWNYEENYRWYVELLRDRIVCRHIHFIWGNHDCHLKKYIHLPVLESILKESGVVDLGDLRTIRSGGRRVVLCHYPIARWDKWHKGSWNIHGHSHGLYRKDELPWQTDAGVDCWNYGPVSIQELETYFKNKGY